MKILSTKIFITALFILLKPKGWSSFAQDELRDTRWPAWGHSEGAGWARPMYILNMPGISLQFLIPSTSAEPLFQRWSCHVTKGDPALPRWLWSSLLKDHLWPTIGCRTKGTYYGLVTKALHNWVSPHPERAYCQLLFHRHCLPVLSCHHTHSDPLLPGKLLSLHRPLLLSEAFLPSKDASKKCSLPLFDLIAYIV